VTYYLKAFDSAGVALAFLPEFSASSVSQEFSDVGSISFSYPRIGINADQLDANRIEVGVFQDGVEMDDARYTVMTAEEDELDETGMVSYTGLSLLDRLKKALVYSADGSTTAGVDQTFLSVTPGQILKTLFDQNFARGTGRVMRQITYASFSNTTDSNGAAWAFTIPGPITYTVGVNYLEVVRNLVNNGTIEVRMVGRDLRVYNPGTMGTDRTAISEPVVLREGRELKEAPRTKTREAIAAVALISGDNNILRQETDSSVAAAWGEDETFISQGGISDSTTLGILAAQEIERSSEIRIEYTHSVVPAASPYVPYADYRVSDYIYTVRGAIMDRLRIRQLVLDFSPVEATAVSLVLNDKFLERDIVIARRVDGILGGATATGSVAVPTEPAETDNTTPNSPASLGVTSNIYVADNGQAVAQAALSWPAPTQNTDSSTLADLDHYETQWHADPERHPDAGHLTCSGLRGPDAPV
jgi:predicted chitinase